MRRNPKSSLTASEAKSRFGELLERVSRGEEIVITRHDKPVARVVPVERQNLAEVQMAVAQLKDLRTKIQDRTRREEALTDADVRSAIAEGRR